MYDATLAETVTIRGDGGDEIEAYLARPMSQGPQGGVVVIHHRPGYDPPTKEIARRHAAEGRTHQAPDQGPVLPAPRPVRRGRSISLARPGQRARRGTEGTGQDL